MALHSAMILFRCWTTIWVKVTDNQWTFFWTFVLVEFCRHFQGFNSQQRLTWHMAVKFQYPTWHYDQRHSLGRQAGHFDHTQKCLSEIFIANDSNEIKWLKSEHMALFLSCSPLLKESLWGLFFIRVQNSELPKVQFYIGTTWSRQ